MTMTQEEADQAANEQRRLAAEREFAELYWNGWRVISWLAYRHPSMICAIEDRDGLSFVGFYDGSTYGDAQKRPRCLDKAPANTLRIALQEGKATAIDGARSRLDQESWALVSAVDADRYNWATVCFERAGVLPMWPEETAESIAKRGGGDKAIAEEIDRRWPGTTDEAMGRLLANGTIRSPASYRKRGQRARGKA